MKLVMTLLVRDEVDVLAAMIEHHLAAGVDFLVVTDNGSVDGTTDVLAEYQRAGVLEFRVEPTHNYDQARWVTDMARRAADVHHADWVINADADEFWFPRDGASLKSTLALIPAQYGTVEAARENLVADPQLTGTWPYRLLLRDVLSLHERGGRIGPKTAHRADPEVEIAMGNHGVAGPSLGPAYPAWPLMIWHVPDRSYRQYARKIANGGSSYAANTEHHPETGWHWRAEFERLQRGELEASWRERQLDGAALAAGVSSGRLVADLRLRDRLHALVPHAVVPQALQAVLGVVG
jgi:hypothetical protein